MKGTRVLDPLRFKVRCMGLFWSVKVPKMLSLTVGHDRGGPASCLFRFCETPSQSILAVCGRGCVAKVFSPVVGLVSVDVVNQIWKVFMVQEKSHSVCVNHFSSVPEHKVSILVRSAQRLVWFCASENQTGKWVVSKASKINVAHAVALLMQWFGKWRLGASTPGRCVIVRGISQ